ncbi:MAG: DUF5663 domain-containing protein [Candidatus Saccharibacteria bacterium]|nr:DUF5663 domain-containing protein [Candidatus Saccharibacteria bacterium]
MFKLDDNFLIELGLGALPPVEKNKMLAHIYETLEMRVGMRLAEKMTNEQLDEFEAFINNNDEAGALKWLETNFPNYKQVVAEELEKLKAEIKQAAPQIVQQALDAAPGQPPLQQAVPQQQPQNFAPQQQSIPQPQLQPVQQPMQQQPILNPAPAQPQFQQPTTQQAAPQQQPQNFAQQPAQAQYPQPSYQPQMQQQAAPALQPVQQPQPQAFQPQQQTVSQPQQPVQPQFQQPMMPPQPAPTQSNPANGPQPYTPPQQQ